MDAGKIINVSYKQSERKGFEKENGIIQNVYSSEETTNEFYFLFSIQIIGRYW